MPPVQPADDHAGSTCKLLGRLELASLEPAASSVVSSGAALPAQAGLLAALLHCRWHCHCRGALASWAAPCAALRAAPTSPGLSCFRLQPVHGARIVSEVVGSEEMFEEWKGEMEMMAG